MQQRGEMMMKSVFGVVVFHENPQTASGVLCLSPAAPAGACPTASLGRHSGELTVRVFRSSHVRTWVLVLLKPKRELSQGVRQLQRMQSGVATLHPESGQ